ncbi:hypothetical protein ACILD6_06110 [Capnocytophaga canimorsus]|uniref:hypothetical protein n=1 Tax=Capnocytophaga canimorsus TaxID=28188 RepID=UPI0037CE1ECB
MNKIEMISNVLDAFFKSDSITKLEEHQADMSVDFISEGQRFLSFCMDKQLDEKTFPKGLFPFFNRGEAKVCAFCDYIVFTELKGKLFVLLIELKKGRDNVTKQLNAGECFAEFVIKTANRVYNQNITPEIRKISIRDGHIKTKAKPKQRQKPIQYDHNNFHTFEDSKFWLRKYLV